MKKDPEFRRRFKIEGFVEKIKSTNFRNGILILLIVFTLQFFIQISIEQDINLPEKDPFLWFTAVMRLKLYQNLDLSLIKSYTSGSIIFTASPLILIEDYTICYYFFKFIPMFLMGINVLVIYELSKKFFKKPVYILFTLILFISFRYFMYRSLSTYPSIIATTLGLIFLLTFESPEGTYTYFKRGVLMGGIFLCHPLNGVFYILLYLLFEIYSLIKKQSLEDGREENDKFLNRLKPFLRKNGLILLFISIPISFYMLSMFLSGIDPIASALWHFTGGSYIQTTDTHLILVAQEPSPFITSIEQLGYILVWVFYNCLDFATIVLFIALFLKLDKRDNLSPEKKQYIRYALFVFITTTLIIIISRILEPFNIPSLTPIFAFLRVYSIRLYEIYQGFWAIIFILVIKDLIIALSRYKYNKKSQTQKSFNQTREDKAIMLIILIGLGSYLYVSNLLYSHNTFYYSYYDDEDLGEITLFAGDYFYNEFREREDNRSIFLFSIQPDNIWLLLTINKYFTYNYSYVYNNTNFGNLTEAFNFNDADYAITPKYKLEDGTLSQIKGNYEILFENPRYIFYKI